MKAGRIILAVLGAILKVFVAVVVIMFLYRGAEICYDYGYRIYTEEAVAKGKGKTVTVEITENMTPLEIGELFLEKGLIGDSTLFVLQYYLSEHYKEVKPGEFELSTAMTVEEMMEVMAATEVEEEEE